LDRKGLIGVVVVLGETIALKENDVALVTV